MEKPPVAATLVWDGDRKFRASSGTAEVLLDGNSTAGPSPVQALVMSLGGCMSVDVVDILRKGRHAVDAFSVKLLGWRADEHPRRLRKVELHFELRGNPPATAVERAIQLSRDRYCSVWQSMQQDIELVTTFEVKT